MPEILRTTRRLWPPATAFAILVLATVFGPDLLHHSVAGDASRLHEAVVNALHIALWLCGAFLIVRLINRLLWEHFVARVIERPVPRLLKDSLGLVIFLLAVAGIIGIEFGQSLVGVWATSGAIGIVLGIALRGIILDIFTGLAVNFDHSYRIGDWVELIDRALPLPPIRGKVTEINWRATRILTEDKRVMVVPNSRMGEMVVANMSLPDDICRFDTQIVLDFSVPTARAMRVLLAGVRASCGPLGPLFEPAPVVVVWGSSQLGVEYHVRHWQRVDALGEAVVRDIVMQSLLRHLAMAGLSPAYPKVDTFRAKMPVRQLEHHAIADRAKLLRHLEIFDTVEDSYLERLGAEMQPQHFAPGDTLMVQGAASDAMYIVAEGLCEVWHREDDTVSKIDTIEPGEFVGERSMLTGEPHTATVTALTEAVAYAIRPEHLAPILATHAELYEHISHLVALRHLRNSEALAANGEHHPAHVHNMAAHVLERMRSFFHSLGHHGDELVPAAPAGAGSLSPRPATAGQRAPRRERRDAR